MRNHTNATAVIRSLRTSRLSIVTLKRTTSKLLNVRLLVIRVEKPFTTTPLTTLIFAPLINNPPLQLENALLQKLQMLRPRKDPRGRIKQVREQRQNKPTPTQASAAGSSWEADPVLIPANLVPATEQNIAETYRQHWPQIRTRFSRKNRLQDWYNFRLSTINPSSLREQLSRIFADQTTVFKVNFAFGFILCNTETGALQYHHPSANNNLVLEQPFLVSNREDLERLYQQIAEIDYLEWVRQQRPNGKWVVDLVTNITWFITKIRDHPIGRGKYLPGYICLLYTSPSPRDLSTSRMPSSA